jgi:hypothetical protein
MSEAMKIARSGAGAAQTRQIVHCTRQIVASII